MPSTLHDERLDLVSGLLLNANTTSVLDLGCGVGRLLTRLLDLAQFNQVTGIDSSATALAVARSELRSKPFAEKRLTLILGNYTEPQHQAQAHDAVTMIETIEHLDPARMSAAEHTVFAHYRPRVAVVTTPNREYNPLLGLAAGCLRDPDHRFEWERARFRAWASGVAKRHGYTLYIGGIGEPHPELGSPTQYAHLLRNRP